VAAATLDDICAEVEVSGPGFINLTLSDRFVAEQVGGLSADERLGVGLVADPETVLIDYSSPNVAKEMHIGHLRSTLIGDALARVLGFIGHDVVRENHIGDWGTPFGMLIEYLLDVDGAAEAESFSVRDLNEFYAAARRRFDDDPAFAERCRNRVVLLQGGDDETLHLWRIFVDESMRHAGEVYEVLGVLLTPDDVVGESFYNPLLPVVVSELDEKGLLVQNDGALCVFPEGFENRQGEPLPLIVRKSDGGYGYPATDLAALRDRSGRIGATRMLYVVAAEQTLHFRLVFAAAGMADYLRPGVEAVHVSFGFVLGPDGKKMASRAGESERLIDLLSEGIERAEAALKQRSSDLTPEVQIAVAHALGVGAVKYADLSTERMRDYVFDWDRMLAFEGDTGPYLQYAHARIRSIFRRAGVAPPAPGAVPLLGEPQERALGLHLLGFAAAVETTAETCSPSKLCTYLFELATSFTTFYEACRVLVDDGALRDSRLGLCDLTARVLELGLSLLGIEAPEQM
jgi:arginyl-tRNA synthetase